MNALETALKAKLAAYAPLTAQLGGTAVFNALAPPGSSYPLVEFSQQAGTDDNDTTVRTRQFLYLVKGIAQAGGMTAAGALDDLIDAALEGQPLAVSGWAVFWLHRESSVRYAEYAADGRAYFHAGGVYRIRVSK